MHWPFALVQFFFTLGWTVYVIFLPGLLKLAGIDAAWLPWILIVDQLLFAAADLATGIWLDRSEQFVRATGNWLTGLVLAACAVFMLLPFLAHAMPAWLFVAALFVWVICSSVLRVPPLVLLAKYATPRQPARMTTPVAAYLFGIGVAGAVAPYLTVLLKNRDPLLPFVLASVALAVTTLALRHQLIKPALLTPPTTPTPQAVSLTALNASTKATIALPLLIAVGLFAFGMQIHAAVNSAKLFIRIAPGVPLEWLMPLFWAGFSVAMFPVSQWLARGSDHHGIPCGSAGRALWLAGLLGGMALVACATAPTLPILIALQIVAGAAWAVVFLAAITAAAELGRTGHEGKWIGAILALFALASRSFVPLPAVPPPGAGRSTRCGSSLNRTRPTSSTTSSSWREPSACRCVR